MNAWIVTPTGAIHWAQRVPLHPFVSDENGQRPGPAWVARCDERNGHKGWVWTLAEVRELDRRPATKHVCFFCRALLGMGKPVNPRQLHIFEGEP